MAEPRSPDPAMLVVAAFSRHTGALDSARARLEADYGPVALASTLFDFHQTDYYAATMGAGLKKQLLGFARLVPQDCLPDVKVRTNALERELADSGAYP